MCIGGYTYLRIYILYTVSPDTKPFVSSQGAKLTMYVNFMLTKRCKSETKLASVTLSYSFVFGTRYDAGIWKSNRNRCLMVGVCLFGDKNSCGRFVYYCCCFFPPTYFPSTSIRLRTPKYSCIECIRTTLVRLIGLYECGV